MDETSKLIDQYLNDYPSSSMGSIEERRGWLEQKVRECQLNKEIEYMERNFEKFHQPMTQSDQSVKDYYEDFDRRASEYENYCKNIDIDETLEDWLDGSHG